MITLLLCLVSIFTYGHCQTFQPLNSSFVPNLGGASSDITAVCPPGQGPFYVPDPHDCTKYYICVNGSPVLMECPHELYFDPTLKMCNWPEEAHCTAKCLVQVVLADEKERVLTTWSPEKHCAVQNFQGFPTTDDTLNVETIHQCSNGLTIAKSQRYAETKMSAYNPELEQWEDVELPGGPNGILPCNCCISNYALAANPSYPSIYLSGGKMEIFKHGYRKPLILDTMCSLNCKSYVDYGNKDGSAWSCTYTGYPFFTPAFDSCATISENFLSIVGGRHDRYAPVKDVGFFRKASWQLQTVPDSVHFRGNVKDCISHNNSHVYAIGAEKMYHLNPENATVTLLEGNLPVYATSSYPVRLFINPETSEVNIIGGTENGIPSCHTYHYAEHKWNKSNQTFPCGAGKVLGIL